MPLTKETKYQKIMGEIRREYPRYSLHRRKKITYAIINKQKGGRRDEKKA